MKNNNVIDKITKEILNSDELSSKLKKLNSIDEIYSFYKNVGSMPSKEEFKEHVFNLITTGDDLKKLSEISLSKIRGGARVTSKKFDKIVATLLSTLTLTAPLSSGFFVEKETNGANSSNAVSEKKGKISKKRKIAIGVGAAGAGAVVGVPILGWALYKTAKTLFKSTKPEFSPKQEVNTPEQEVNIPKQEVNIPEVETNNSNKVEVLVIGGTHQTRQTLIDDIRNNKDKTGEDICRKLAKGGNITKGMDPDRAQFSNWSIKEVEANDPNLEESLKTAEMAIVIITNLEEATRINDAIRRATIKITRTPGSYSKEESSCLVACVADEAAPSVKEEVDQNRRLGIKQGLTGNQLENFARRWQLPMQALNNYLMVDLGYIWDRDNGKYYLNRYST